MARKPNLGLDAATLQRFLDTHQVSGSAASQAIGKHRGWSSKVINGQFSLDRDAALALCRAYDADPKESFGIEDEVPQVFNAQALERLMAEKELSGYRLAKLIGVHQTNLYKWLKGESAPTEHNVQLLAETLEVDAAELYRVDAGDAALPASPVLWIPMTRETWNALKAGIEALEGHSVEPASKVVSVEKVIRELQGLS